ncbi:flagellin [Desulfofalx alkaliphila]|uniref:flagellin N-terminal helical domain-containing protein n=1 Tax=Desulfofalx alkaliphila TaxID=105483 RepID=UPI0004E16E0D|nr:flagellin [Desulfofalx alkaliphila]
MRINNNIMALNAHRQLGMNQTNASKSMEKLSSGFRINRAGDDAAGLAISEKMRGQIRGLKQAQRNAQDGISLIQTAEGALNETHAILQRMRELATQSATDTNTEVDRGEIQKEIDQLAAEITRIADTTEFNTQNLLGGEFKAKFHIGANKGQNVDLAINAMDADALKVQGEAYTVDSGIDGLQFLNRTGEGFEFEVVLNTEDGKGTFAEIDEASGKITVTLNTKDSASASDATLADVKAALESVAGEAGFQLVVADDFDGEAEAETVSSTTLTFEIDEDASKSVGINVSSQTAADAAITTINDALETVSAERSKLGAMQNRLEHTIANLGTSAENLQAAESRIRDLDMAEEIMAFTKNNILQQAATAMLAQANMAPQSVLQLLG